MHPARLLSLSSIRPFAPILPSRSCHSTSRPTRILVTGSCGQIGSELVTILRNKYGGENVVASDIRKAPDTHPTNGPFIHLDVTDKASMSRAVVEKNIDWMVHNSSVLSVVGEQNPKRALEVNIKGATNALEVAAKHNLRIFSPSSIAAFGASTPPVMVPDTTIQQPTTIYGVSKVYLELLGNYYAERFGLDFRSLRYPGVISSATDPGGGTTDYAVAIYKEALLHKKYTCYLREDTPLPMMFMEDCLKATILLLEAPEECLKRRVYNVTGMSFTPAEIAASIKKRIPEFEITYKPDARQKIADSWPTSLDDSNAKSDWGWAPDYDLEKMTDAMLSELKSRLN